MSAQDVVQDPNLLGWVMYFGDHPIGKTKWGLHLEAQWRRDEGFNRWQQSFYRPAINYDVNSWLQLSGGYAFAKTYPYGSFPVRQAFDEHRTHQQAVFKHKIGKVRFAHRARHEQRWLDIQREVPVGPLPHERWRFQQRFRWQTRATIPINDKYYWTVANELLVHVPPNMAPRIFDQNRAYGALGVNLSDTARVEVGYLNQYLVQRNARIHEVNHSIQVSIFSTKRLGDLFRFR